LVNVEQLCFELLSLWLVRANDKTFNSMSLKSVHGLYRRFLHCQPIRTRIIDVFRAFIVIFTEIITHGIL